MAKRLPARAQSVVKDFPKVWAAYEQLGAAAAEAGPITADERRLVKLALAIGRGAEGAVHSHVRQAVAEGISKDKLRHVALLAIPTLGFAASVAALSWIEDVIGAPKRGARRR